MILRRRGFLLGLLVGLGCLGACGTVHRQGADGEDLVALRATIDELYGAFCFDPGADPDWEVQRRIYLSGAVFVAPIDPERAPVAEGTEAFLEDFAAYAASEPFATSGFHERIIGTRLEAFGGVAHAFVAFEGFVPADGETKSRGLDSLQFVRAGSDWRLVSFTTQYESEGLVLPEGFLPWQPVTR